MAPASRLAAAGGLALSACSSGAGASSDTSAIELDVTRNDLDDSAVDDDHRPRRAVAPLTGLPIDPATAARPALVVKIDNFPTIARPQVGINQADIVFEEIVEGITRFAAVFQSEDADPVGPIRSARTSDINILAQLGRPLLAWSGGNPFVTRAIQNANIDNLTPDRYESAYFRTPGSGSTPQLLLQHVDLVLARDRRDASPAVAVPVPRPRTAAAADGAAHPVA